MKEIELIVNENEFRYLISCGFALLQNIPENSLATYCHFNKEEIVEFTIRMRDLAAKHNIEL